MDFKQHLIVAAKGAVVGGTMLVPGVSGGTMCIILGVYDRLIHAVSTFFQSKRANFWLLFCFCLGAGAGIFLLSKPLLQLMELFPKPASFFFMGAVAGSVPMTFQKAKVTSFHWRVPVYVVVGMIIVWVLAKLPTMDQMSGGGLERYAMLVASGVVAAVALVLPGISVSYLLLVLGMYSTTIQAIGNLDFEYLIPLGLGGNSGGGGHHQGAGASDAGLPPGHLPDYSGLCGGVHSHHLPGRPGGGGVDRVCAHSRGRVRRGL